MKQINIQKYLEGAHVIFNRQGKFICMAQFGHKITQRALQEHDLTL